MGVSKFSDCLSLCPFRGENSELTDADKNKLFVKMIHKINEIHGVVTFLPMNSNAEGILFAKSRSDGKAVNLKIGINGKLDFDGYLYNLAHELSHYYLHFDKGDIIKSIHRKDYEEQASRAAKMLLDMLG